MGPRKGAKDTNVGATELEIFSHQKGEMKIGGTPGNWENNERNHHCFPLECLRWPFFEGGVAINVVVRLKEYSTKARLVGFGWSIYPKADFWGGVK